MRIETLLWIEGAPKGFHGLKVSGCKLLGHEIDFLGTDAVFASNTATKSDTFLQDVVTGSERALHFAVLAFIVQDKRVYVTVAGVEDIWDSQTMLLASGANEPHDLRQFTARHDPVLRYVIGADPANRDWPDQPQLRNARRGRAAQ